MMEEIFRNYLGWRFTEEGAVTPGQKLEVVRRLLREAQEEACYPIGARETAMLPVDHAAVRAVLRGEKVSVGAASVEGQKDWSGRLAGLSTFQRVALLAGVVVTLMLLAFLLMRPVARAEEENAVTPSPSPSPSPTREVFTPGPDYLATLSVMANALTQAAQATPLPPPTATPALVLGQGGPAEDPRDPASLEIGGKLFVLSKGQVNEEGAWAPDGPQWLAGTQVRRVFAIPYAQMQDVQVVAGDEFAVRLRGGAVVRYTVRDVLHLLANQTEILTSLYPTALVLLPMAPGDIQSVERLVVLGEALEDQQGSVSEERPAAPSYNAYTTAAVNLRTEPGLNGSVAGGLPPGTPLLLSNLPAVSVNGLRWRYVSTLYGLQGWVAEPYLALLVPPGP
jgi:hypothetical protein